MASELLQNQLLAKESQDRNKQDNTWALLQTKGYVEVTGVDNIYKSELAFGHHIDDNTLLSVRV